jgi:hypothetical protein
MNTQNKNLFTSISEAENKKLTNVVEEKLQLDKGQVKTFTCADLWNIQRQSRTCLQKRHCA